MKHILEITEDSITYIYDDDTFPLMVLSEPILAAHKGRLLKDMEHKKDVTYNDKRYLELHHEDIIYINRNSIVTYYMEPRNLIKNKKSTLMSLINQHERKDMILEEQMSMKPEDIVTCRADINHTYVIFRLNNNKIYQYIKTNINNLKLR